MKIAVVVESLDRSRGGAETSTRQFMDELLKRGHQLAVITRSRPDAETGLSVITVEPQAVTRAGRTRSFLLRAAAAASELRCDLIHAFVPCPGADVYQPRGGTVPETVRRTAASRRSSWARCLKRASALGNRRQVLVHRAERRWLTGRRPPLVFANSRYVVRQLKEHYNLRDRYIRRVFNGVSRTSIAGGATDEADGERVRAELGIGSDAFVLLTVAHNFQLKGVARLIEATAELRSRGRVSACAVVVGRGNPAGFRRLANRLGIADAVHFTGPCADARPYFRAADVLVHPTYYDPCSRVVLEAITYGLPVLCTRWDGSSEMLLGREREWVVPSPDDIRGLADRLTRLAEPRVRRSIVERTRGLKSCVSMARHVDEICSIYDELIEARRRGR